MIAPENDVTEKYLRPVSLCPISPRMMQGGDRCQAIDRGDTPGEMSPIELFRLP